MRITFLTSLTVAAAGSLQNLLGLSHGALSANESVWLLVWGVALMSLAGTLRAKVSARRSRRGPARGTSRLEPSNTSIAGTI